MSIEHDVTYKWVYTPPTITVLRQIVGAVDGSVDTQIPTATYNSPVSFALTLTKALSIFIYSDQAVVMKAGGTNAVQRITITGSPAGGSFTETVGANTTAAIPYNATATQVAAALNLLASVGTSGVTATGGPLPGTPVDVTFSGLLGVQPVTTMTHADSLTGGSSPAVANSSITTGVAPDTTKSLLASVPLVWDSAGYFTQPFLTDVTTLRFTNLSGAGANIKIRALSSA